MARKFDTSPFDGHLEVVATLRDDSIKASIAQMRSHDALLVAVRQALKSGVSIDDLSEASGLSPQAIRARLSEVDEDLAALAGLS